MFPGIIGGHCVIPNLNLMINHIVQTPSYHSIIPMTKYFDELKLKIAPIMMTWPMHFHISSLTKKAKEQFLIDTANYQGYNRSFIDFVRDRTVKHLEHKPDLAKKVIKHLTIFFVLGFDAISKCVRPRLTAWPRPTYGVMTLCSKQ